MFKRPAFFLFEGFYDGQDSYSCPKALQKADKCKSVRQRKCHFCSFFLYYNRFVQKTITRKWFNIYTHTHMMAKYLMHILNYTWVCKFNHVHQF